MLKSKQTIEGCARTGIARRPRRPGTNRYNWNAARGSEAATIVGAKERDGLVKPTLG